MCFVDGENLTFRGQELAAERQLALKEGEYYRRDVLLWLPRLPPKATIRYGRTGVDHLREPIRSYYYTSLVGDESALTSAGEQIRALGFEPKVFKKERRSQKTKGVDISLAKDFLSHAYLDNYDVAVLFAGDADYLPLVEEVKRQGKVVCVSFFRDAGMSRFLRLAADEFVALDDAFEWAWRNAP
jgi:hypothetical protein